MAYLYIFSTVQILNSSQTATALDRSPEHNANQLEIHKRRLSRMRLLPILSYRRTRGNTSGLQIPQGTNCRFSPLPLNPVLFSFVLWI